MDHHLYFNQRDSYAFDLLLELATQHKIYLKPVLLEKNDWIFNRTNHDGQFTSTFSNNHFYGNWREITKNRWLHQAYWRYVQARWGYSSNIHSWELLNEGDPYNSGHYTQTDEFGAFMHCRVFGQQVNPNTGKCDHNHPNKHLVSTSTWHSFPKDYFWSNPSYPNVDFGSVHRYVIRGQDGYVREDEGSEQRLVYLASDYFDVANVVDRISRFISFGNKSGTSSYS